MPGGPEEIIRFIEQNNSFTVICHMSPDGDALGSAAGLAGLLNLLGKTAELVCCDAVPDLYRFLPCAEKFKLTEGAVGYPAAIAVDCADAERMGSAAALFDNAEHTACIDHHGTNMGFGKANWVEPTAAAAELIYRLIREMNAEPDGDMANSLLTALITDTGCFAYSNVTRDTMRIAGELISYGGDNAEICRRVYHTDPVEKVRLHAFALNRLEMHAKGRIALSWLTEQEIAGFGADASNADGIVEKLRDIDTVEISAFLRQQGEDVKVSLRTKKHANAASIAAQRNGGGHTGAAGYTEKRCTIDDAKRIVKELAQKELERCLKA